MPKTRSAEKAWAPKVHVVIISISRVDPDRTKGSQRVRLGAGESNRIQLLPPFPDVVPDRHGLQVPRKRHCPIRFSRVTGSHRVDVDQAMIRPCRV